MKRRDIRVQEFYLCRTHLGRDTYAKVLAIDYNPTVGEQMVSILYADPLSPTGSSIEQVRPARLRPITRVLHTGTSFK